MQISRFSTARMKTNQIPYVIFQATYQFSFNFCITLQCRDTQLLWNFLAEALYPFDKRNPSMYNFSGFECSNESSPNFSYHFWNDKARFYSNFASLFGLIKDNFSVFFYLKPQIFWTKPANGSKIFRVLISWVEIQKKFHVMFETTSQVPFKLLITF